MAKKLGKAAEAAAAKNAKKKDTCPALYRKTFDNIPTLPTQAYAVHSNVSPEGVPQVDLQETFIPRAGSTYSSVGFLTDAGLKGFDAYAAGKHCFVTLAIARQLAKALTEAADDADAAAKTPAAVKARKAAAAPKVADSLTATVAALSESQKAELLALLGASAPKSRKGRK